jgi:hypothetical protein
VLSCLLAAFPASARQRWRQLSVPGSTALQGHGLVSLGGAAPALVRFGGCTEGHCDYDGALTTVTDDQRGLTSAGWEDAAVTPHPPARWGAVFVPFTSDAAVLFGGAQVGLRTDTWTLAAGRWSPVVATLPHALWFPAAAYDPAHDRAVVFGGRDESNVDRGETRLFKNGAWATVSTATVPDPRFRSALAYSPDGMILFGGRDSFASDHQWRLTCDEGGGTSCNWGFVWPDGGNPARPTARYGHAMAWDPDRHVVVLFGGYAKLPTLTEDTVGDTWEWDGATWTAVGVVGPSPRFGHAMAYDPVEHRIVLNGGSSGYDAAPFDDTWVYETVPESPPDAGTPATPDAGPATTPDGGAATAPDAGTPSDDPADPAAPHGHYGCTTATLAGALPGLLLLLARRRRRY